MRVSEKRFISAKGWVRVLVEEQEIGAPAAAATSVVSYRSLSTSKEEPAGSLPFF
jgi:hypothetical protein